MSFTITSEAFENGTPIPRQHAYTGEGQNISPPLAWSDAPVEAVCFALICDDPDAPSPKRPRPNPWVYWVLYGIPGELDATKAQLLAAMEGHVLAQAELVGTYERR